LNCVTRILFIPEETPRDGEHPGAVASHQYFIRIPIPLLKACDQNTFRVSIDSA
jgi:hypothetical protein